MEQIGEFARRYGLFIFLGLLGCSLLLYGLWPYVMPAPTTVEIIHSDQSAVDSGQGSENCELKTANCKLIYVDVAGAVEKPGVYTLPGGSRIGDALVAAGGLAASADRAWVAQTLNLAAPIKDGEKVYIPEKSDNQKTQSGQSVGGSESRNTKVNVNTASAGELDALPGIGAVRAEAIITARPYQDLHDLVTKAKLPESVYAQIKDAISLY